jgi:hypothetical protein
VPAGCKAGKRRSSALVCVALLLLLPLLPLLRLLLTLH